MKKIILLSALVSMFAFQAEASDEKFYVGAGYQGNKLSLKEFNVYDTNYPSENYFKNTLGGINVFAGYKLKENIDLELGYFSRSDKKNNGNAVPGFVSGVTGKPATSVGKNELMVLNFDGIFSEKVSALPDLKVLGILSVSSINYKTKATLSLDGVPVDSSSTNSSGFGIGAGLGLEYVVDKNFSLRTIVKYSEAISVKDLSNLVSYSVGGKFSF